ncbi:GNAT family N-acetyltransferase [Clostridium gasigenes]|uniref:GNAT family N-acetyltransferase n=1 Tax=Clostridium gasigenes TaxID=94869 RepID=A0A7X0SAF2_9CLOT|nr:GNAT family N-acetyltransferase [Clostridium gasigenes]MBB6713929.1 GNAT family N-acetyltransferase [Clostridium gasigenes]
MKSISYRELKKSEIRITLFANFNRYQDVKKCWRNENGEWILKDIAFTEQWGSDEYKYLIKCMKNTIKTGGVVVGAFNNNELVGFASVESQFFGSQKEYLQLSSLHISYENRSEGIGKKLFSLVCKKAEDMGAQSLYISAHSSQESRAFYKAMDCIEAVEYNTKLVDEEPCDCQLEYRLLKII